MSKEIWLHIYRTGRLRRFGFHRDKRAAACSKALLEQSGWRVRAIKTVENANKYYVFAERIGGKTFIDKNTTVIDYRKRH